ncbi:hypothetical protein YC2023_037177 [Brassica napus]
MLLVLALLIYASKVGHLSRFEFISLQKFSLSSQDSCRFRQFYDLWGSCGEPSNQSHDQPKNIDILKNEKWKALMLLMPAPDILKNKKWKELTFLLRLISCEEATGDRLNDCIRSIEYVRVGERINAAYARPRGSLSSCIYFRGGQSHPARMKKKCMDCEGP